MTRLRTDLRIFCAARNWRLVTMFCDRDSDGSDTARPGFAGALDALALPDHTTLVVPSLAHLSPEEAVRAALTSMMRRTGATLVVTEAPHGRSTSLPDPVSDTGSPQ